MISFKHKGSFRHAEKFFKRIGDGDYMSGMEKFALQGVQALSSATPKETGLTSASWNYEIKKDDGHIMINWTNSNVNDGVNIALILQLGHGTGTGGYVEGIDYINPALVPVFDEIAKNAWEEVTRNA